MDQQLLDSAVRISPIASEARRSWTIALFLFLFSWGWVGMRAEEAPGVMAGTRYVSAKGTLTAKYRLVPAVGAQEFSATIGGRQTAVSKLPSNNAVSLSILVDESASDAAIQAAGRHIQEWEAFRPANFRSSLFGFSDETRPVTTSVSFSRNAATAGKVPAARVFKLLEQCAADLGRDESADVRALVVFSPVPPPPEWLKQVSAGISVQYFVWKDPVYHEVNVSQPPRKVGLRMQEFLEQQLSSTGAIRVDLDKASAGEEVVFLLRTKLQASYKLEPSYFLSADDLLAPKVIPTATPTASPKPFPSPLPTVAPTPLVKPARPLEPDIPWYRQAWLWWTALGLVPVSTIVGILWYRKASGQVWARLVVMTGDEEKTYLMRTRSIRLGRAFGNEMGFSNDSVSRYNAEIHLKADGTFVLTDLSGDRNTPRVNKQHIQHSCILQNDDVIELGEVHIRFESE